MDNFEYEVTAGKAHTECNTFTPVNPLNRPPVRYDKAIRALISLLIICTISIFFVGLVDEKVRFDNKITVYVVTCIFAGSVYCCMILKRAIVWFVHLYQHCAPDSIRLRCVFEPSCSEYMILAVYKYGAFIGLFKGIKRLLRCHPPGGVDYP